VKLLSNYLIVCDNNLSTLPTDRRTDRQHSHSNTAQRTCVLSAVKTQKSRWIFHMNGW